MARVVISGEKQGIMILIGILLIPIIFFCGFRALKDYNKNKYADSVITHTGKIVDVELHLVDNDYYREIDKVELDNGRTISISTKVRRFNTRSVGAEVTVYELDYMYSYSFDTVANYKNVDNNIYIFIALLVVVVLFFLICGIKFIMGKSMI